MAKKNTLPYKKRYKLRALKEPSKFIEVTFPYEVVEKEARERNLTISQFIDRYHAVAQYDSFPGVRYTFEENKNNKEVAK